MERVSKTPTRRATRADLPLAGSLAGGGESFKRQVKWDSPARKRAIGFTHLKNRLRYRHLDDPQYPNCFVLRRRAILEKTRLFRCSRPACERCVNTIADDLGEFVPDLVGRFEMIGKQRIVDARPVD